jgi:hypothetical protein
MKKLTFAQKTIRLLANNATIPLRDGMMRRPLHDTTEETCPGSPEYTVGDKPNFQMNQGCG